jgi:hypothetical protein
MCELRKSGEVCVEAFDFVIIIIAFFKGGNFAKGCLDPQLVTVEQ